MCSIGNNTFKKLSELTYLLQIIDYFIGKTSFGPIDVGYTNCSLSSCSSIIFCEHNPEQYAESIF